jgi:hypothetical protein
MMDHVRHATRGGSHLSQTIPGYRGYSGAKIAHRTDRIFSEEILSKLSEAVATASRIKRHAGTSLEPEMLSGLEAIEEKTEYLAQAVAETAFEDASSRPHEHGLNAQVESLDSSILEKVGSINQTLSVIDLEGGAGISCEDLDSISDLLGDLRNLIRRRATMLGGRQA